MQYSGVRVGTVSRLPSMKRGEVEEPRIGNHVIYLLSCCESPERVIVHCSTGAKLPLKKFRIVFSLLIVCVCVIYSINYRFSPCSNRFLKLWRVLSS